MSYVATSVVVVGLISSSVVVGGCSGPLESDDSLNANQQSERLLQTQETMVSELRESLGSHAPETLKALATLIRLRTAAGDIETGAELFDELLSLDLRTSPILVYATPPIELTRHLGGLGELTAARRQLETSMKGGKELFGLEDVHVGEARRALNRLRVALDEVSDEEQSLLDLEPGPNPVETRIRYSDRPRIGERDWRVLPEREIWSAGMGGHDHFDNILEISAKAGIETAERLRASSSDELSLVTRIRRHGRLISEWDRFGGATWRKADHDSSSTRLPGTDDNLLDLRLQIQALTRALDRIPSDDDRFEAIREERARLQYQRAFELNTIWESIEQTYIPTTLAGLQQDLDPETVILYYMVAEDHTDLIVVPAVGPAARHRISLGLDDLEREISIFLDNEALHRPRGFVAVTDSDPEGDAAVSRRLYDALVAPADPQIRKAARIVIIPDGPLHKLPFAALELPSQRYLAQAKPFILAPSAAAFVAITARRPRSPEGNRQSSAVRGALLAFGNPAYGALGEAESKRTLPYAVRSAAERGFSGGLPPLPGSAREAREIGELFEASGLQARVHLGEAAGEGVAKEQIENATFVHFAVHGFVDGQQPEHSFLALAVPAALSEGDENGIVEGWEIVDEMHTTAELVTLSACETSLGRERSGEGPSSLNRAFLAAGARSVLSALWRVDDAATSELMIRFYRHLTAGTPKADALRLAQVELIESPELGYTAPVYWAGFQLTGDWQ